MSFNDMKPDFLSLTKQLNDLCWHFLILISLFLFNKWLSANPSNILRQMLVWDWVTLRLYVTVLCNFNSFNTTLCNFMEEHFFLNFRRILSKKSQAYLVTHVYKLPENNILWSKLSKDTDDNHMSAFGWHQNFQTY